MRVWGCPPSTCHDASGSGNPDARSPPTTDSAPLPKWLKWIAFGLAAPLVGAALVIAVSGAVTTTPGDRQLAPGLRRNTAQYVTMPDSVKLAVDLWLPADLRDAIRTMCVAC